MNNKRLLAILLAALMTASMTACGAPAETETTGSDEVLETVETEAVPKNDMEARKLVSDNLPDKDFGGEDFTILGYDFTYGYMYAEELNGDVFNDALFNRNTGVSERFNVKMNILGEADYIGTSQIIKTAVLSGEDTFWIHEVLNKGSADIASYYQSKKSTWEGYMESILAAFENYES